MKQRYCKPIIKYFAIKYYTINILVFKREIKSVRTIIATLNSIGVLFEAVWMFGHAFYASSKQNIILKTILREVID